jgi:phage shock protein PspC (stress-responsive transcriptional regulator)
MDDRQHDGPEDEREPSAEEPPSDEPTAEERRSAEPSSEEPPSQRPSAEEPAADGPTAEGPTAEEPTAEEPTAEEPPSDEPTAEEPTAEAPSEPAPEDPRGSQAPPPPPPSAAEAPTQPLGPEPRRLLRSRSNRVLGGVCGGLGRYFNVDPILFRIGAIALALIGGAGVLLYLAALVLIPNEAADAAAQPPAEGRNRTLTIVVVVLVLLVAWPFLLGGGLIAAGILFPLAFLVAAGVLVWWIVSGEGPSGNAGDIARRAALGIGVLILCGVIALGGAWAAAAGGGVVVGVIVIASGAAILAGAFVKPVRWLILPAVTLALSAGAVSAAGIDLDGGVGDKTYRPASAIQVQDRYELGIGELEVDLRSADLPAGDTPLRIDVGVGEARLIVPEDVCVATDADVGVGVVRVFDRDSGGVDVDVLDEPDARPDTTRLIVNADVGLGALNVVHDPDEFHDGFRRGDFDDEFEGSLAGDGNTACLDTGSSARG